MITILLTICLVLSTIIAVEANIRAIICKKRLDEIYNPSGFEPSNDNEVNEWS